MQTLHVACAAEGAYDAHSAAMLHSVTAHAGTRSVQVHYLHGPGFPGPSKEAIGRMLDERGASVSFIEIDRERVSGLPVVSQFTSAMWYRIFLPDLLPDVERVLYLDVDTIVADSLEPLWKTDLEGNYLAAVTNVFLPEHLHRPASLGLAGPRVYFNSGVLLMNLEEMRRDGCTEALRAYAVESGPRIEWPDQDTLNVVLGPRRVPLHPRWNSMNSMRFPWSVEVFGANAVDEARRRPGIRHFEGPATTSRGTTCANGTTASSTGCIAGRRRGRAGRPEGRTPANVVRRLVRGARLRAGRLARPQRGAPAGMTTAPRIRNWRSAVAPLRARAGRWRRRARGARPTRLRIATRLGSRIAAQRQHLAAPAAGGARRDRADRRAADRLVPGTVPVRPPRLERGSARFEQLHHDPGPAGQAGSVLCRRVRRRLAAVLGRMMRERFLWHAARYPANVPLARTVVVIKEPNGSQSADVFMSALPNARFLFLLRDGRDIVDSELAANLKGSWVSRQFAGAEGITDADRRDFIVQSGHKWLWRTEVVEEAYRAHPGPKRLLRYEDLRSDPTTHVRSLLEWLELEVDQSQLAASIERHAFERVPEQARGPNAFVRSASPGLWRENLSADEQAVLEGVIGPKLRELGYDA